MSKPRFILFFFIVAAVVSIAYLLITRPSPPSSTQEFIPLVSHQPCQPVKDLCEIKQGDNHYFLSFKSTPSYQRLLPVVLRSEGSTINKASITMIIDGKEMPEVTMKQDKDSEQWHAELMPFADVTKDNIKIRLILVDAKAASYVGKFSVSY